jgi:phenylalanyl-tRNA synthetase beta chain
MRVPLPWLREYCSPGLDARGVEERLTMTGTKVEAVHRHGVPSAERFVVGHVLAVEQHPDADRLKVCTVDLGEQAGAPASIVCGAPNVAPGQTVAVARPGAVLPDGRTLERLELRGVASEGMILAESELGIGSDGRGIMVLDEHAPGTPLADVLPISVDVLELEVTPNRPDCLGIYGVARELHAATGAALAPAPWSEDPGAGGAPAGIGVEVACPELCPRFTARAFEDVTIAPSPLWLRARLLAAGQRPISNVVDITNYVMLLAGQPMHAFDLDEIAGGTLRVRTARAGERLETLDGQERALDERMVLIEDADGPTSIAGVMGGARSEVGEGTTRVLMEAASWNGPNIHRTSQLLGLRSEASGRFEKGLQPEQCMHAQALAAQLMIELCGATLLAGTVDVCEPLSAPRTIRLRERRVEEVLGVAVELECQEQILAALDFATARAKDGLDVSVPPLRRADVTREVDLIEEVARIDGLERLPATLPARRGAAGRLTHAQRLRRAAEDAMVARGLHEVVGWSFTGPELLERLRLPAEHDMRRVLRIENPLSEEQSILRPTLLGSLLDAARYNAARLGPDLALFESGTVYRATRDPAPGAPPADEHHALGVLLSGAMGARSWRGERLRADFFSARALLEALLGHLHAPFSVRRAAFPFLHPGRSAEVLLAGERAGFLGELHPLVSGAWDLERTAAFAIDLGTLAKAAPELTSFRAFASVPALRQDIAVTLPESVPAEEVLSRVRTAGGETLAQASVFDVYTSEKLGPGRRSLALALSFQDRERTLTDEDVAPLRERIVAALAELGGELRG